MTEPDLPTASESTEGPAAGTQPEPATQRPPLTEAQKNLIGFVAGAVLIIAGIGFSGSYSAVTDLAAKKHFGWFAHAFPAGIDAGIVAFLALDLLLAWLRMPYPLLRQGAWGLTIATISFNAAAAWGDPLAVGMHAAIPVLFIVAVEAARHAIGRIADIVADRHIESPPLIRWLLSPIGTYLIWRRMRVWQIPSYLLVISLLRELRVFRAKLRRKYGWLWRWKADANELLVFEMARFGISVSEALGMPEAEAEVQRKAEAERRAEARREAEAEAEALRLREARHQEEAEARRLTEAETEARIAEVERRERIAKAEAEAELAVIEQRRLNVEAEAELQRRRATEEQQRLAAEASLKRLKEAEDASKRRAEAEAQALEMVKERLRIAAEAETRGRAAVHRPAPKAETVPEPETVLDPQTPKSKPEAEAANPKQPAQIGGRRARVEAEVEAVLELMRANGGDTDLKTVMEKLSLTQTTAWDRLNRARNAA